MAGQFCSSALQKLDKPGGATMSNFPGRLRRRSGVADNWRDPPGFTRNFSEGAAERWSGSTPDSTDGNAAPGCPGKLKARSVGVAQTFFGSGRPTLPQPCRDAGDPIDADQPTINESRYQDVSASGNGCSFRTQIRPRSRRSDHKMEPTLTVGGQPIKRQSAVYRAAKRFVEQHLDCRHLEVGEEHPLDRGARHGCPQRYSPTSAA